MLVGALSGGLGAPTAQQGTPTYAPKVEPADLFLDWHRPAAELHRVVRLGRAWTTWRGRRLLVLAARVTDIPLGDLAPGQLQDDIVVTGDGGLRLITVQPEGRSPMAASDWLRGAGPDLSRASAVEAERIGCPAPGPGRPGRHRRRRPGQRGRARPSGRQPAARPGPGPGHGAGLRHLSPAAFLRLAGRPPHPGPNGPPGPGRPAVGRLPAGLDPHPRPRRGVDHGGRGARSGSLAGQRGPAPGGRRAGGRAGCVARRRHRVELPGLDRRPSPVRAGPDRGHGTPS